jgi:hypothetical protein
MDDSLPACRAKPYLLAPSARYPTLDRSSDRIAMDRYSGLVVPAQKARCDRLIAVDADVIDQEFGGKFCGGVGSFGPVAAYGEIEQ